nr:5326_t:CDS:2 [Entrophospora candida]
MGLINVRLKLKKQAGERIKLSEEAEQNGKEEEGSDVLYDSLLNHKNKDNAFHNFKPIEESSYTELIDYDTERPSDNEIDEADENQCLVNLVNSTGTYYEICDEENYNNRWNNLPAEVKKGIEGSSFTTPYNFDNHTSKGNLSDQEYNDEIDKWKKINDHDTLRKYKELKAKVEGGDPKFSKYLTQFKAKVKEILNEKKAKKQDFYNTKNTREKIKNILKCKDEVIKLIEDLVAGGGPNQNISQLREKAKNDIQAELDKNPPVVDSELGHAIETARAKKESGDKLKRLIANGKVKNNYEELETILKEIHKDFSETPAYRTEKAEIDALEKKMQDLDPTGKKYAKTVQSYIEAKLSAVGLKEQDLTSENKKDFKDLKENKISDKTKLNQIRSKALEDIGKVDATKKLEALQSKVQTALDSKNQGKIDAAKVEVNNFISKVANNVYYKEKETAARALLTRLEKPNQQNDGSPNNPDRLPWGIIVPVALLVVLVVGIAIVMV